jgi:hypothetical protein
MWETLERVLGWFGIKRESRIVPLDAIVQKVVRGATIEDIESIPCPYCRALLTVRFEADGKWFFVLCTNKKSGHHSPREFISTPPAGWESHVERELLPGEEQRYYRLYHSYVDEIGTIRVRTSWWTSDGHACGYTEIATDAENASLWRWILSGTHRNDGVISEEDLESLREEYLQTRVDD